MIVRILKQFIKSWPFWLGLFSGILFITLNITGRKFQYFPGDLGDARFNNYVLEHAYKYLTGQTNSLWNAPFMYPESNVITYSDNLIGTAPFYSIFRLLGYDRETSFQFWFVLIAVLNYLFCYLFLKNVFGNNFGAVLGAFIFAFSLSLQSQITHAQTFTRFPVPLSFLMIFLFSKELKPKYFFAGLFFLVYQLYCGIYLGILLIIPLVFLIRFSLLCNIELFKIKMRDSGWLFQIVKAALMSFLLSMPLIIPYAIRSFHSMTNHYKDIYHTLPTLKSYFFSQMGSLFWDFLSGSAMKYQEWWDHQIFAGGIATICMILFIIFIIIRIKKGNIFINSSDDNFPVAIILTFFITFLFFTRIDSLSLYSVISKIPGFSSLRSLTRIINIELIFYSLAAAYVFNRFLNIRKRHTSFIFILFLGLLVADNYFKEGYSYRTEKTAAQTRTNALAEKMKDIPAGSVVSYEPLNLEPDPIFYQLDAMMAAQKLDLITINGYSATSPPSYKSFWSQMSEEARKSWLKSFNFSVDTIYIIH